MKPLLLTGLLRVVRRQMEFVYNGRIAASVMWIKVLVRGFECYDGQTQINKAFGFFRESTPGGFSVFLKSIPSTPRSNTEYFPPPPQYPPKISLLLQSLITNRR